MLTIDERVVTEQSGKAVTPVGGTQDPGPLVSQVKSPVGRNAKAKPSLQARVHCTACSSSVQFLCPLIGSLGRLHEWPGEHKHGIRLIVLLVTYAGELR